ncbi:uncharacterized protein LOC132064511 [Lycium ferocissimum]|uniref:uncharacterized protein LOC132064511 n=1 Tax=Lycium ferocissimum TaxID=112874 RepID=UPI0028149B8A|nr:uncharacterized protein LOC132064511 [Lycium ferocissimum]
MKITKAMKKLKFWSKKKKKKRAPLLEQPPSPPPLLLPCYYHCPYYSIQPSAPPLPPWFDYEQQQQQPHDDSIFTTEQGSSSTSVSLNQTHGTNSQHTDNISEINQPKQTPFDNTLPQQNMVPNQVYGVPITAEARTERAGGAFGCVINYGAHLFRCFFPCFHIRELK